MSDRVIAFDIVARDKASRTFSKIGGAAKLLGVVGLGSVISSAVNTEAQFSKTMNVMQATSGATGSQMDDLRKLAVKMGADTQFSAGEAAQAMLELSKAGLKADQVAGGLKGTLTLAAAGGLDMASAATIAGNAINTFGLQAGDMNKVAAALAGGANASTASVESIGQALRQVGPGAKDAGLSIQETVAALAAFDNAGVKGSDAGTSLKTMLSRLVPMTEKASTEMEHLGISFTDSHGNFKSLKQIAQELQNGLKGLSDSERSSALTTMFGSDARRAATILATQGAKGIGKLIKKTSDQRAAEKMAAAAMKGTSGALERMKGSLETAALAIGQLLAPAVVFVADKVGALANEFVKFAPKLKAVGAFVKQHDTAFKALAVTIAAVVAITKVHTAVMAVQAAGGLLPLLKATKLVTTVTKAYTAVQWLLNAALTANPIGIVVVAIAALVAGIIIAYKKSETFRTIVQGAFRAVMVAAKLAFDWVKDHWKLLFVIITGPIGAAILFIKSHWETIGPIVKTVMDAIKTAVKSVVGPIKSAFSAAAAAVQPIINKLQDAYDLMQKLKGGNPIGAGGVTGFPVKSSPAPVLNPKNPRSVPTSPNGRVAMSTMSGESTWDYDELARAIVNALRDGTQIVQLQDAGQLAYATGATFG